MIWTLPIARRLLLALIFPAVALGSGLGQKQRLEDFEQIVSWVREDYGPLKFKQQHLRFEFEKTTASYRTALENETSDENFKYLLARYIGEFKDAHFSVRYPTKATAKLGFTTDLVQGEVVIDSIDRNLLSEGEFPFERGDEIVIWDRLSPLMAARNISRYLNVSFEPVGLRVGVFSLASRKASRTPLPSGSSTIVIKQRSTGVLKSVTLNWRIEGAEPFGFKPVENEIMSKTPVPLGIGDMCSEKSRIAPPPSARIIIDVPFTAFSFPSAKGPIGFIRIPHFYPQTELGGEIAKERFEQYERVIAEFEKTTVGLIIDQDFNCGGSVIYVYKLFSLFYSKPFEPLGIAFRTSQSQIDGLRRHLSKFGTKDDGFLEFKNVIDEIERARSNGLEMSLKLPMRGFMEVKLELPGGNLIQPNAIQYTKPIVLLINEMSGSGGDVFPSLMKDFARAKLVGTRTMGAGGHLWDDPHLKLKHSGGVLSLTRSLIYRQNGAPIENSGVEPDISYEVTMDPGGRSNSPTCGHPKFLHLNLFRCT